MTTFQQKIDQLAEDEQRLANRRKELLAAIQNTIADHICADIGIQFHKHLMAFQMSGKQYLLWSWLAGKDSVNSLGETAAAFGESMVSAGYLIKKNMYHNDVHGGDIELSQADIEQCVCPIRREQISKKRFADNCYPIWECTEKWTELCKRVHESPTPLSTMMPMKIFDVDSDGCYAANGAEEFRAWYIEKYGAECAESVEELVELTLEEAEKRMIVVNHDHEKLSLLRLLDEHVKRNGKVIAMLSCESH